MCDELTIAEITGSLDAHEKHLKKKKEDTLEKALQTKTSNKDYKVMVMEIEVVVVVEENIKKGKDNLLNKTGEVVDAGEVTK
ncbi:hypothetical protein AKJ16_DCAP09540 [Drosera capensis]